MIATSQTVLIDSAFCASPSTDTPWDYSVVLAPDLVRCKPNEKLRITLKRLECRAMWLWIPRDMYFYITLNKELPGYRVKIPGGNPTFRAVAEAIKAQVPDKAFNCTFSPSRRGLTFVYRPMAPLEPCMQLEFTEDPELGPLLGFSPDASVVFTEAGERRIDSEFPLSDTPFDAVKVHVTGVTPEPQSYNAANSAPGTQCEATDILAAFQVDCEAFEILEYRNIDDTFAMTIGDKAIRTLHFRLTDWHDRPLTNFTDHYIYLQIDTLRLSIEDIAIKLLRAVGL